MCDCLGDDLADFDAKHKRLVCIRRNVGKAGDAKSLRILFDAWRRRRNKSTQARIERNEHQKVRNKRKWRSCRKEATAKAQG